MNTVNKKILLGTILWLVATAGTLTSVNAQDMSFGWGMKMWKWQMGDFGWGQMWGRWWEMGWKWGKGGAMFWTSAIAAIESNNYTLFTAALVWTNKEWEITQTEFNDIVARHAKQKAVQSAIEANDYNAFVKASTPTQAEFDKIVTWNKTRKAVDAAIKAKDYTAFTTAIKWTPQEGKVTIAQFNKMVNKSTKAQTKQAK
jgi:hypothetical protein